MFAAWRDTLVVPVPKKGDLTMCDKTGEALAYLMLLGSCLDESCRNVCSVSLSLYYLTLSAGSGRAEVVLT